jgi:8-oxo-dGTP pyrophosphatase MutT (NUDIX family)
VQERRRRGGQQRIPRPTSFRDGGPPAWVTLAAERRRFTLDEIRARLAALPPAADAVARVEGSRAAAVLVPLYEAQGETHVVLIKRPEDMPSHKGEIAFPGGKFEPGVDEGLPDTALREAHEEVGLVPGDVEIVAQLDGIGTVASRFTITPFVGFLRDLPALAPNPREVVRILEVPLSELLDPDAYRAEHWDTWMEDLHVHFYELEDETVWGATARILTSFLTHLVEGR